MTHTGSVSDIPDTTPSDTSGLPDAVAELVEDLAALTPSERMDLLQELADDLPAPPDRLHGDPGFERVEECQSPVHVLARVEEGVVRLYVDAPPSAAATRARSREPSSVGWPRASCASETSSCARAVARSRSWRR